METELQTFRNFLETAFDEGNYATDDVIAFIMPLFKEVLSFHEMNQVGPFEKEETLFITDHRLDIDENFAHASKNNISKVHAFFTGKYSSHIEVVQNLQVNTDIDMGSQSVENLNLHFNINEPLLFAAYVPGYMCYELLVGHHDAQTDIFCLGLVLGSVALGLDLYEKEDLKIFTDYRNNPVRYNNRIHPTISSLITEMTELDRSKRTQDLYDVIHRLDNYRDFDPEKQTDLSNVAGWVNKELTNKDQQVLNKLRNRLFDTSHRNRLLFYKPNMRFMNLTVSSVPLVLHYQSIRPELLFTWNEEISGKVKGMKEIILNKYLRFEDHQYLPSTLDKIRVESQHDVHEYGFSQLKLVITFLNWHNLKEDQNERIQSPLLLIPVELKRNKKLKEDHYVLKILDNEAEVNPVVSNYLRELYGIKLPDFVDLDEMSLEQFYKLLKEQVDGANQGITLNYIDKPRIKLIHSVAKQTVSNYKRRLKRAGNTLASYKNISYSYQTEMYKPLGLEIFRQRIEPRSAFLEFLINEDIKITEHQLKGTGTTKERQLFEIADSQENPFSWDFDLCNMVLGNFNYKKMSLVRDYNHVIDKQLHHSVFENLFSSLPKQHKPFTADLNKIEDWNHVITADPTQTKAILQSRTGESYIIQGPPGTGKSQTITNLIADFVARGKSVLFVCEKRAALDVVYHRLKQQGLDELCCYIHDSQGDKREFIRNLKLTYEDFTKNKLDANSIKTKRDALLGKMNEQLELIRHFHESNTELNETAGIKIRKLLERVIELKDHIITLQKKESEQLPYYSDWLNYGEVITQLNKALDESGIDEAFSDHPFSKLKETIFTAEHPHQVLDERISRAKLLLLQIKQIIGESGIATQHVENLMQIKKILNHALILIPLSESNNLHLISAGHPQAQQLEQLLSGYRQLQQSHIEKKAQNTNWTTRFSLQDTLNALAIARQYESSFFGFLNGSWRTLKKQIASHYDFSKHAVKPTYLNLLQQLNAEYESAQSIDKVKQEIQQRFTINDIETFHQNITQIRSLQDDTVMALLLQDPQAAATIRQVSKLKTILPEFETHLAGCMYDFEAKNIQTLYDDLESVAMNADALDDLLPALKSYALLPPHFKYTLRTFSTTTEQTEAIIARKTLDNVYQQNKRFKSTDSTSIENAARDIQAGYKQLLQLNADSIRAAIRKRFLGHVELSTMAISQLNAEQRQFKKEYNEGRKILENEFGKSMRYKSIRELSGKESGLVLKDLKPVWLMSPLSVSDSLPLDTHYFDAIIFDEASQITLEEGIPSLYRAPQTIIVGDEKQMPPSNFFTARTEDPDDLDTYTEEDDELLNNDADSLLVQGSRKLNSVMLGWHYRSRYETLISFSNHAFYNAGLLTIPDKTVHHTVKPSIEITKPEDADIHVGALFDRSISYHFHPHGIYEKRANHDEANYIAHLVKKLLEKEVPESIGIVAFSQEQQHTIEDAMMKLAATDKKFEQQLEEAYTRTEEDQFVGLFVKNLENVQGDERDIIIMSVCYGFDTRKKMIMNFGPINKKGGEKRLNVIFSRAKKHMAIVSSIKHHHITNEYNEGANYFKRFLHYAELISDGNTSTARTILDGLIVNKKDKICVPQNHIVIRQIKQALQKEGYEVDSYVGQSDFKCSLAVKAAKADSNYTLGILIDDDAHYSNENLLEQYYQRPAVLQSFGWRVITIFAKDWLDNPKKVIKMIIKRMSEDIVIAPTLVIEEQEIILDLENQSSSTDVTTNLAPANDERELPISEAQLVFERFTYTDATSNKFWEVATEDIKLTVRYGRIGTKGQVQLKTFASAEIAEKEKQKMIREKTSKGYKAEGK